MLRCRICLETLQKLHPYLQCSDDNGDKTKTIFSWLGTPCLPPKDANTMLQDSDQEWNNSCHEMRVSPTSGTTFQNRQIIQTLSL